MHICYVLGTFPTTSETFVSDEIISCVKAGHKVTIARIYQGNAVNHANVEGSMPFCVEPPGFILLRLG